VDREVGPVLWTGERVPSMRAALLRSALLGLVTLLVVASGAVAWAWHLAREDALRDAALIGQTTATGVIRPLVTPALLSGDPAAGSALDRAIDPQVKSGTILLAKIWRRDGTVAYSNNPALTGRRFPLERDVADAFGTPRATAEVSSMKKAENIFDHTAGPQVEVYAPFTGPAGEPLLYEVYLPLNRLPQAQRTIARELVPMALTVLVCLQLLQLPLWVSLVRSTRSTEAAGRRLLERSAVAAETERRRLARFLHDDVIQNLAGVAYALEMMPQALPADTAPAVRTALADSGRAVTSNLGALRTLIADLYPGQLDEVGLEAALDALLEPLRGRGVAARVTITGPEVPAGVATAAYSVAREAVRNADLHARATTVTVELASTDTALRLTVTDDGVGFGTGGLPAAEQSPPGHYGLRLMRDTVDDLGGSLDVDSAPGRGTTVCAVVPLTAAAA
jgi:two-component system, NarL family, sensor kinase